MEIKFQNGAHLKKKGYFWPTFRIFSHQGTDTKTPSAVQHIYHTYIQVFCSPYWPFYLREWKRQGKPAWCGEQERSTQLQNQDTCVSSLNRHSDVSRILHVNFQKKLTYCRITALLILLVFFFTCHTSVCLFFSKNQF